LQWTPSAETYHSTTGIDPLADHMDESDCAGHRTHCCWRMGSCRWPVNMEGATTHSRLRAAVSEWTKGYQASLPSSVREVPVTHTHLCISRSKIASDCETFDYYICAKWGTLKMGGADRTTETPTPPLATGLLNHKISNILTQTYCAPA